MGLNDTKAFYIDNKVQIIAVDKKGIILSSDNVFYTFKKNEKLEEQHPFFYTLLPFLAEENTNEAFPCINLQIGKVKKIVDVTILKRENSLYVILTDFTSHYENSQPVVQEKNEAVIAGFKLKFERELLFAKEEFKNNFLANLNHEIRNPLNALLGFTELLGETKLTFQQKETLGVIQKTGVHIKVLMDDLLDISKIEMGALTIKEISFNLHSVISSVIKHFQIKKNNPNITLTSEAEKNLPVKLIGDPTRVNQILYNLLENAYRNTTEGNIKLQVTSKKTTSKDEALLQFTVSDTGNGISKPELKKVFNSYVQLEKVKPLGEGLGLKIVKDLTTLLKGTVTVKSEETKGSVFTVIIPFKIRKNSTKRKSIPKGSGILLSKRILAVEDDMLNQMLLMKQFINNEKGYTLEIAASPEIALQMIDAKKYLAIIIKQSYNATTGIEFLKELKSNSALADIPVLVVSGKAMIEEQEAILNAGASAFLKKPYSKSQIFKALQKL